MVRLSASDRLAPGGSKRGIGRAELFAPVIRPYSSHPPTWNRLPGEPPMHSVLSAAAIMPARTSAKRQSCSLDRVDADPG